MIRLGIVNKNGTVCFEHHNINECRAFLRDNGLACSFKGWESETHRGLISFSNPNWYAAFWKKEN
jgi:hypothetical protein